MSAVLAAIERAGDEGGDSAAVIDAFFDTRDRRSVLGTYDIDRNGDTTLTAFGGNRVRDGALAFDEVIESRP
jgi:branched-chain amino acid transport system substrate-binding protein